MICKYIKHRNYCYFFGFVQNGIECTECGEEFTYVGSDMVDRSSSKLYTEASKEICDECWEAIIESQEK